MGDHGKRDQLSLNATRPHQHFQPILHLHLTGIMPTPMLNEEILQGYAYIPRGVVHHLKLGPIKLGNRNT